MAQTFDDAIYLIDKRIDHDEQQLIEWDEAIIQARTKLGKMQSDRDIVAARLSENRGAKALLEGAFDSK